MELTLEKLLNHVRFVIHYSKYIVKMEFINIQSQEVAVNAGYVVETAALGDYQKFILKFMMEKHQAMEKDKV